MPRNRDPTLSSLMRPRRASFLPEQRRGSQWSKSCSSESMPTQTQGAAWTHPHRHRDLYLSRRLVFDIVDSPLRRVLRRQRLDGPRQTSETTFASTRSVFPAHWPCTGPRGNACGQFLISLLCHVRDSRALLKSFTKTIDAQEGQQGLLQGCAQRLGLRQRSLTSRAHNRHAPGISTRRPPDRGTWQTCHRRQGKVPPRRRESPGVCSTPSLRDCVNPGKCCFVRFEWRILMAPRVQLKPYVARNVHLTKSEKRGVLGKLPPGGLQGARLLELSRAKSAADERVVHS